MPKLRSGVEQLEALKITLDREIVRASAAIPGTATAILTPIANVAPLRAAADLSIAASTKTRSRDDLDRRLVAANSGITACMETVTALIEATNGILALEALQVYVTAEIARAAAQEVEEHFDEANRILGAIAAHVTEHKSIALAQIGRSGASRSPEYNEAVAARSSAIQTNIDGLIATIPSRITMNRASAMALAELDSRTRSLELSVAIAAPLANYIRRFRARHPAPALAGGAGAASEGPVSNTASAAVESGLVATPASIAAGVAVVEQALGNHADGDPMPSDVDATGPVSGSPAPAITNRSPTENRTESRYQEAWDACYAHLVGNPQQQGISIAVETNPKLVNPKAKLWELLKQVRRLKDEGHSIEELANVLEATRDRISGEMTTQAYAEKASAMHGKPSLGWKVLGACMIAFGAAILAAGIALPILFPPLVYVGSMVAAVGVGVASSGFCFFSQGMASSNYKAAHALNNAMTKEGITKFSADQVAAPIAPATA